MGGRGKSYAYADTIPEMAPSTEGEGGSPAKILPPLESDSSLNRYQSFIWRLNKLLTWLFHVFTEAFPWKFSPRGIAEIFGSPPPPVDGTKENPELSPLYGFWDMKKCFINMKHVGNMKKCVGNIKKYVRNMKKDAWNMWELWRFPSYSFIFPSYFLKKWKYLALPALYFHFFNMLFLHGINRYLSSYFFVFFSYFVIFLGLIKKFQASS